VDFDGQMREEAVLAVRAANDRLAFVTLYDRYFHRIYNYMRVRILDAELAGGWLFAIARNALADHLRATRRRQFLSLDVLRSQPAEKTALEDGYIQHESRQDILKALSTLTERERDLVGLKFYGGLSNRQIAKMSGLSESNVGVILYRAMHRLRETLGEADLTGVENTGYERA
jgi:RNA polymerase sigma-70 factor (ECF subfamily)